MLIAGGFLGWVGVLVTATRPTAGNAALTFQGLVAFWGGVAAYWVALKNEKWYPRAIRVTPLALEIERRSGSVDLLLWWEGGFRLNVYDNRPNQVRWAEAPCWLTGKGVMPARGGIAISAEACDAVLAAAKSHGLEVSGPFPSSRSGYPAYSIRPKRVGWLESW